MAENVPGAPLLHSKHLKIIYFKSSWYIVPTSAPFLQFNPKNKINTCSSLMDIKFQYQQLSQSNLILLFNSFNAFMGTLADDVVIRALSLHFLEYALNICHDFGSEYQVVFISSKYFFIWVLTLPSTHCIGNITMGSFMGRGNQYIQLVKVLYCKLPTNSKQLPAFPLEIGPGFELRSQRLEVRVLPLYHHGPFKQI